MLLYFRLNFKKYTAVSELIGQTVREHKVHKIRQFLYSNVGWEIKSVGE